MRRFLTWLLASTLSLPAWTYDVADLTRDARARHGRLMSEVRDLMIEQEGTPHAMGAGSSGFKSTLHLKGERWRTEVTIAARWEPPAGSKVVGEESVGGRSCWVVQGPKVRIGDRSAPAARTWIDKKHFLPVQTEAQLGAKPLRTTCSDFRRIRGDFEMPYLAETFSGDRKTVTTRVTRLEVNTSLPDRLFDAAQLGGGPTPGASVPRTGTGRP